ncbi:MAG: Arc family DNA-binding protein [Syntrophomonadaceae bacterium]|jgi:hypothetical protein|nr:Arc family DNA-binding protein [Syntrophomonadaceae bacterium]MDD4562062.1 Arc family DNA-binding protein [Syntrophomonadaceae bacterium]
MTLKKKFLLRVDQEIYDALERWANDEFRSVNAHIEYILRNALKEAGRLPKIESKIDTRDEK